MEYLEFYGLGGESSWPVYSCQSSNPEQRFVFFGSISGVYGVPCMHNRIVLWDDLGDCRTSVWALGSFRDLNTYLYETEKVEGAPPNKPSMKAFGECLFHYHLFGLGFQGPHFT